MNYRPEAITVDLTYKCTLRCLHCFNYSGEHDMGLKELTDEEIMQIAEDISILKPIGVCFCGGEPLLRKNILYKAVKLITDRTNGETQVNMVTNGELLNLEVAKDLKDCGINAVQISIDGATSETHDWMRNKEGVFDKAIKALSNLKEVELDAIVSCCPTKRNINEIEEVINICNEYNVKQFRMQPLMLLGRAKRHLQNEIVSVREYKKIPKIFNKLQFSSDEFKMDLQWGNPLDHLNKEMREKTLKHGTASINAYGHITVSPYLPLYLGNIREHSLKDYWENGLGNVMSWKFVENMDISSVERNIPENYLDKSLDFDLIKYKNDGFENWDLDRLIEEVRKGELDYA